MIIRDLDDERYSLNNERMNSKFLTACRDGNLEVVKNIYSQYSKTILKNKVRYTFFRLGGIEPNSLALLNPYYYGNAPLKAAFESNQYEVVEFLLTDNNFIKGFNKDNNGFRLAQGLSDAISYSNLKMIDLVVPFIKNTGDELYNDIHHGFKAACRKGDIQVIDYILSNNQIKTCLQNKGKISFGVKSPDYFEHLTKHGLVDACFAGNVKTVEYFTKSENPDIFIDFNSFANSTELVIGSFELLEYLIFNLNINKTSFEIGNLEPSEKLGDFLEMRKTIKDLFAKRELFKEINNELSMTSNPAVTSSKKKAKL